MSEARRMWADARAGECEAKRRTVKEERKEKNREEGEQWEDNEDGEEGEEGEKIGI